MLAVYGVCTSLSSMSVLSWKDYSPAVLDNLPEYKLFLRSISYIQAATCRIYFTG